jgi:aryl-alcohol dehydrogenase-like predicted oxidoreductase
VTTASSGARRIGRAAVSPIGMGCAGLSLGDPPSFDSAVATLCAALDAGTTLLDSAAVYIPDLASPGHNEDLIAAALAAWKGDRSTVIVSTKGGHTRVAEGLTPESFSVDGSASALRADCDASLRALRVDAIDLYFLHWPDPRVGIAESVAALAELRAEGKVRMIGVSNVTVEQLEEACATASIDAVQNRFSLSVGRSDVLDRCDDLGIALLAYSPLGGLGRAHSLTTAFPEVAEIANARGVSPQRVALAWILQQSDVVIPIPGCRRPETARDCAAAAALCLEDDERARIDAAVHGGKSPRKT